VWELALSGLEMAALAAFIYRMGPPPPLGAARHVAWVNSVLGRE